MRKDNWCIAYIEDVRHNRRVSFFFFFKVHDWHDEAKWNKVATVGPVPWFTDLFNAGCRIVWIDTPATRSVVISNSRGSDSNLNKLCKYYEIGDFRDLEFPVMLDLAKRNTKDSMYSKHFVVRWEQYNSKIISFIVSTNGLFYSFFPPSCFCFLDYNTTHISAP